MALPRELEVQCLLCKETIKCQQNNTNILVDHVKLKHPDITISNIPKELNIFPKLNQRTDEYQIVSNVKSSSKKVKITGKGLKKIMEENPICDFDGNNVPKSTENDKTKTIAQSPENDKTNQIADIDGNYVPKSTENDKTKKIAQSPEKDKTNQIAQNPSRKATKRRRLYKTSVETWKPGRDKILCPKCDAIVRPIIRKTADRVSHSTVGAALIMTCWPFCFFPFLFQAPIQENLHCSICGYFFGSYDYQKQTMNVPKQQQQQKTE